MDQELSTTGKTIFDRDQHSYRVWCFCFREQM